MTIIIVIYSRKATTNMNIFPFQLLESQLP